MSPSRRMIFSRYSLRGLRVQEFKMMDNVISRLREFMENEARGCPMDFGCVTPEYVYRSWGGAVALEDIAAAMKRVKLPM